MAVIELFLGVQDSGKSRLAETELLSRAGDGDLLYVATLPAVRRYAQRIAEHKARRDDRWRVVEIRSSLLEALAVEPRHDVWDGALLDGLIAYVARRLAGARPAPALRATTISCLVAEYRLFLSALSARSRHLSVVSNVPRGCTGVQPTALDRLVVDVNLQLCRTTAEAAAAVWLVANGQARRLEWDSAVEELLRIR